MLLLLSLLLVRCLHAKEYTKKDVHQHITKLERENLWNFLERNVDNCLVTNKYVLDYLVGKYPYCYHGYFYISEQKMLTPIYMLAQKAIDKTNGNQKLLDLGLTQAEVDALTGQ